MGVVSGKKNQCQVRIRIIYSSNETVTIYREDEHDHQHTMEDSFRIKIPKALQVIAKAERSKNYSAAQVFNAMRGIGTENGSNQLELAGGGSLTR